jgi:calmodulin
VDGADADGDGIIDKQEMKELMQTLGKDVDDTAIEEILRKADTDGDGVVDVAEVASLVQAEETAIVAAEIFKAADVDGDGVLDKDELRAVMEQTGKYIGEADLEKMVHEADADGDGVVDATELTSMLLLNPEMAAVAEDIAEVLEPTRRKSLLSKLTGGKFGEVRRVALSSSLLSVPYFRSH